MSNKILFVMIQIRLKVTERTLILFKKKNITMVIIGNSS